MTVITVNTTAEHLSLQQRRALARTLTFAMAQVRADQAGAPAVMTPRNLSAPSRAATRATVAEAMLRAPKTCDARATVGHVREVFRDDHVHSVLIVDGGVLLAVVDRLDVEVAQPTAPAAQSGRLRYRVISPRAELEPVRHLMLEQQRRRLAVIDDDGVLLGLLCLKRTGNGFCSDADVRSRHQRAVPLENATAALAPASQRSDCQL